ncbi:hypothetical protein OG496_05260 [Streptomyces sp. NBC_00988]|uniref:hypothetical protein n=1 Tax=Streptomyces sp. NBC_00988 TaxID=2903704 RepID=UPI003862D6B7|nr:hypothetical protein OG496_05260 [Streptomyces sp. NBC_00988]
MSQRQGARGWSVSRRELEELTNRQSLQVATEHGSVENLAVKLRDLLFPVEQRETQGKLGITFTDRRSNSGKHAASALADYRNGALVADGVTVFGRPTLEAACIPPGVGCRWHVADMIALVDGGPMPVDLPAWRTLLGGMCAGCAMELHPKRPATRTAVRAPARPSRGRTAGGGPNSPVYWRSQAENALTLADEARASGDHAASRRLRDRAAEYTRRAGS